MTFRGINLENVKNNNRSAILQLLNNNGAMSRKDIAGRTGLTAASVTLICTELLDEGIIVELGEAVEEKRAGRKKILVDLNPSYKSILCIGIESDETFISVTDCKGNVLNSEILITDKKAGPEDFLEKIAMESARLLWDKGPRTMFSAQQYRFPEKWTGNTGSALTPSAFGTRRSGSRIF